MNKPTHPSVGAFEMMADREPCSEPCDVCALFAEITPERLADLRRQHDDDTTLRAAG